MTDTVLVEIGRGSSKIHLSYPKFGTGSPPQLHITHDYCPGCGGTGVLWLSWRYIGPCPGCKGEGVVAR